MLGGFLNVEGVDLAERGLNPRVVPVDELGIPTYDELVLVASGERVREDPGSIEAFIAALERGTEAAIEDPQAATDALLAADDALDPAADPRRGRRHPPAASPPQGQALRLHGRRPSGSAFGAFLADNGQVEVRPAPADVLTNALLPEELGD